jgi:hypothetical protein
MVEIVEAAQRSPAILTRFSPVIDEKVYFSDYQKRAAAGRFIQKVSVSNTA